MTNALRTPEIDATRFRRVHTKSRKGCATCKRRKIKVSVRLYLSTFFDLSESVMRSSLSVAIANAATGVLQAAIMETL